MVSLQRDIPLKKITLSREAFTSHQANSMRRAIKTHDYLRVSSLFQDGFDPSQSITDDQWNAYLLLVLEGCVDLVRELVKSGEVNVNYADEDGFTGLMIAADHGDLRMVKTLVELGADVSLTFDGHHTAKTLALRAGREKVAAFLQMQEEKMIRNNGL